MKSIHIKFKGYTYYNYQHNYAVNKHELHKYIKGNNSLNMDAIRVFRYLHVRALIYREIRWDCLRLKHGRLSTQIS